MKNKFILYIPLIIICLYLLFSLFMLFNGPISWHITNNGTMIIYNISVCISIVIGYWISLKYKQNKMLKSIEIKNISTNKKITSYIILIAFIISVYYIFASIYTYIGFNNVLLFLKNPGTGYDYYKSIQRLVSYGYNLYVPIVIRVGFWLNLIGYGINFLIIPILIFKYKSLSLLSKILAVSQITLNIIYSLIVGVQSVFLIYLITMIFIIIINLVRSKTIYHNRIMKKDIIYSTISIFMVCFVFLLIFSTFQKNRQINVIKRNEIINTLTINNIREYYNIEEIYLYSIFGCDYVSSVNKSTLEYIRTLTDKKTAYSLCQVRQNPSLISSKKAAPDVSGQVVPPTKTNEIEIPSYITRFKSSVPDIIQFFDIRSDTMLSRLLNENLYYYYILFDFYLTNGYYGQSLAHSINHVSTLPFSSIKGVLPYISKIYNTEHVITNSYEYRVNEKFGWSNTTYWASAPTSFANDFTFVGTLLLYLIIGCALGYSWFKTIYREDYLYFTIFLILSISLLMTPLNNYIGNSMMNLVIMFTTIILIYLERRIYD